MVNYNSCILILLFFMNVLRGIIASIFVLIFTLVAVVLAAGLSLENVIVPQTAVKIIDEARAGERLTAALPDFIMQGLSKPLSALLQKDDVQRFVAEALPADQADSMLRSISGEVVSYIRGDGNTISKIDFAPTEARAVAAAKKIIPGKTGTLFAVMIEQQFKAAGLDKGLEIPRKQLDVAREVFSQFRLGANVALGLALLFLLLVFAVAPHGLAGRLRWCGVAFIIAGCLSAATAASALMVPRLILSFSFGGNIPASIQDFIKDAIGVLGKALAQNIFIVGAIYIGCGAVLIIINLILHKRGIPPVRAAELKI
jgi:hypothetical protein